MIVNGRNVKVVAEFSEFGGGSGGVQPYVIELAAVYVGGRDEIRILSNFSWDDMVAAVQANKPIVCRCDWGGSIEEYTLDFIDHNNKQAQFTTNKELGFSHIIIVDDGSVSYYPQGNFALTEDMVTTIDEESDHYHYPTAKAAYEAIRTIEPGGGLPVVSASDAGKVLRVSSNGIWEAQSLINAEGVAF